MDPAVCDNLIQVFLSRKRTDWPRLIASSQSWVQIGPAVLERAKVRALQTTDLEERLALEGLRRRLSAVRRTMSRGCTPPNPALGLQYSPPRALEHARRIARASGSSSNFYYRSLLFLQRSSRCPCASARSRVHSCARTRTRKIACPLA